MENWLGWDSSRERGMGLYLVYILTYIIPTKGILAFLSQTRTYVREMDAFLHNIKQ